MPPTTTRRLLREEIIKKLYKPRFPILSTTTATAGNTTSLDDDVLEAGGEDTDFIGAWIYIAELVGSGPAIGSVTRVQNVDLGAASPTLDPIAPAFSAAIESGADYEIHYKYHPSVIHDKITEVLDDLEISVLLPLTLVTEGDMENAPATDFTASSATLATDTTTVLHGTQSLKVTATSANGQGQSPSIDLPGSTAVLCAADVFITSGDSAKLILRDLTNSADLETAESDETGWVHLEFTFTTPETCEQVALHAESQANGDITFWDSLILLPTMQSFFEPPSEAEYAADFGDLFYFSRGSLIPGSSNDFASHLFEGAERTWSSYTVERDDTAVVPFRITIDRNPILHPLWIQVDVDFASLSSDTSTTKAPKILVRELALALLWDDMADEEDENNNLQEGLALRQRADRTRRNMRTTWSEFRPLRSTVWGTKR